MDIMENNINICLNCLSFNEVYMHSMHHSSYLLVHFTCIFSFLPIQIVLNLSQKKKKKEKEKTKTVCYKRKCQLSRITT